MKTKANLKWPVWRVVIIHIIIISAWIYYEIYSLRQFKAPFNLQVVLAFDAYNFSYFYFVTFWFLPKMAARTNNWLAWILSIICLFIAYSFCNQLLTSTLEWLFFRRFQFSFNLAIHSRLLLRGLFFFFGALAYWFARYSIQKEREAKVQEVKKIEAEKREAILENAYLRAKIDSHLLFNSLNALYARIHSVAPRDAQIILILSGMIDYSHSNSDEDGRVSLNEDIRQLNRLISLYQELHVGQLNIAFDNRITGKEGLQLVPPLLFIDIFQNVFKHGKLSDPADPAQISLSLSGNTLHLSTRNLIASKTSSSRSTGLANTIIRLEKHFPGRYTFIKENDGSHFSTSLLIRL